MSNVTKLKPVTGNAAPSQLPRPLEKVRDGYLKLVSAYLSDMLDGADDALYDLAEKETDNERERYFEAMRELRIQRAGLETGFRQSLVNQFQGMKPLSEAPSALDAPVDLDSLSLVNEDELETSVALDNMARRARNGCDEQM